MDIFATERYFDLSTFMHKGLFDGLKNVWEALNQLKGYLDSQKVWKIECEVPEGVTLVNPEKISIGQGTVIEPGAYIKGPCIIGKNSTIRHAAYIRGNVVAGDNVVIGHASEVKNSILLNGAQAAHFAYVGDSILGNGVNLGAGTKLANLKFNHTEVLVRHDGSAYPTGLKKFGAILGDGAQTGCNAVTNPGTIFGKGAACFPCSNPSGVIPESSLVK